MQIKDPPRQKCYKFKAEILFSKTKERGSHGGMGWGWGKGKMTKPKQAKYGIRKLLLILLGLMGVVRNSHC